MKKKVLKKIIESAWENRSLLEKKETKEAILSVINDLDNGKISINFNDGANLEDSTIQKLVTNSGYDVVKINRCERG